MSVLPFKWIKLFNERLAGQPDQALTTVLVLVALFILWAAVSLSPTAKAALIAWVVLP